MSFEVTCISRGEIENGFEDGFFCGMSGVCRRPPRSRLWLDIYDEVGSIGLLAREQGWVVGQTIILPKKYARRMGLPTDIAHAEDIDTTMAISCLRVHGRYRNMGIASAMIQETIDFCRSHAYERVDACVDHRPPPETFEWLPSFTPFKKFGFEISGSRIAWEEWPESRICSLALR